MRPTIYSDGITEIRGPDWRGKYQVRQSGQWRDTDRRPGPTYHVIEQGDAFEEIDPASRFWNQPTTSTWRLGQ